MSRSEGTNGNATQGAAPAPEVAGDETDRLPVLQPEEYPTVRRSEWMAVRRRRRRNVVIAMLSAALVVLAVGVVALPLLGRQGQVTSAATPVGSPAPAPGPQATTLLLVSHAAEPEASADSITLFAVNPDSDRGAILFVPTGLLVELPGIGLERLGAAQRHEGVDLVAATVADLLGVDVDVAAALDGEQLGELLGAAGPLTVDVGDQPLTATVPEGEPVRFEPGDQALGPGELSTFYTAMGDEEPALADLPRKQQVLAAFLRQVERDPGALEEALGAGGIELGGTVEPAVVRGVLTELAGALAADQLAFGALPVRAFGTAGSDGSSTFTLGEDSQTALSSLLVGAGDEGGTQVEVRDATGNRDLVQRVEAAHRVDEVLGDDFSVVLGAAADDQVAETEIVVYSDTSGAREQAEAVRDLLGVGTITVEQQPQTAVDVTVRLGDDFLTEQAT